MYEMTRWRERRTSCIIKLHEYVSRTWCLVQTRLQNRFSTDISVFRSGAGPRNLVAFTEVTTVHRHDRLAVLTWARADVVSRPQHDSCRNWFTWRKKHKKPTFRGWDGRWKHEDKHRSCERYNCTELQLKSTITHCYRFKFRQPMINNKHSVGEHLMFVSSF